MYDSIVIIIGTNKYILNYNTNESLEDIESVIMDNIEDNQVDIEVVNEILNCRFDSDLSEYKEDNLTIEC